MVVKSVSNRLTRSVDRDPVPMPTKRRPPGITTLTVNRKVKSMEFNIIMKSVRRYCKITMQASPLTSETRFSEGGCVQRTRSKQKKELFGLTVPFDMFDI